MLKLHIFYQIDVKTYAVMIRYTPANQLTLDGFVHPFDQELRRDNKWVLLAALIPWDDLAGVYARSLNSDSGRLSVDIRMVIGALIVKHRLGLSDRDTVDQISENIYIQYFCGLKSFQASLPFDASLFVDIRKRMGAVAFDSFNDLVIARTEQLKPPSKRLMQEDSGEEPPGQEPMGPDQATEADIAPGRTAEKEAEVAHKGKLKLDATVADQQIQYPTDLGLVNKCREESERLIDLLYKRSELDTKPRTYRRKARGQYLDIAKKKNKSRKAIRKAIGQQLRYLRRNLKTINKLLDMLAGEKFPLSSRDQRIFWVVQLIYNQQLFMYETKTHSCPDRIVNIYQPYVRPIVRGKDKANVEFGSKISISECNGYSKVDHISWDAFNESGDLKMQKYRLTFGCYPEVVLADRIYLTRENRKWLKALGIRISGKPLGRPPKEQLSPYQKRKQRKERNQRNHVEGKIGQGKNGYGLNKIKARRQDTSESWISAIFLVMNLVNLLKVAEKYAKDAFLWAMETKHLARRTALLIQIATGRQFPRSCAYNDIWMVCPVKKLMLRVV